MTQAQDDADAELLADFRPAYTIWRRKLGELDVLVIQGEGGEVLDEDVIAGIETLRAAISASSRFATFYDLSDGMKNLMPHAPRLLSFAAEMRKTASQRQRCTVAVCPNETVRNWVRWILGLSSQGIPAHVVRSSEDGWIAIGADGAGFSADAAVQDAFGKEPGLPLTLLTQPSLMSPGQL